MKKYTYNNYLIITGEDIFNIIKEALVEKINRHLLVKPFFSLALSGGNTPAALYRLLSREKLPWERVKIFLVDERVLPPEHSGLNWKMIKDEFLDNLFVKPLIFPPGDIYYDPYKVCLEIENSLKKELPVGVKGIPVIDLILLGVGSDGHTASLFYGREAFYEEKRFIALTGAPPPFDRRMTFTFPLIASAGERWFLVSGRDKKDILRKIFNNTDENLPAGIASLTGPSVWFLDNECLPEPYMERSDE